MSRDGGFWAGAGRVLAALSAVAGLGACVAPALTRDGQLVFSEGGPSGASVLTANGVEFLDRSTLPTPVLRRSASDPWVAPTGFLLPADGVWRRTSRPFAASGEGMALVIRSSDALVPSWGGEVLLRLDALVPALAHPDAAEDIRDPLRLVLVVDGGGAEALELAVAALENLGERDRVALLATSPARVVLPPLSGAYRSLLRAAVERVHAGSRGPRDLAGALRLARGLHDDAEGAFPAQALVLTDGGGLSSGAPERLASAVAALEAEGSRLTGVATSTSVQASALSPLGPDVHTGGIAAREEAVALAIPPPGPVVIEDLMLSLSSAPAPLRVVEMSGGSSAVSLEADIILLGDMYAGEARTEVARVMVPVWVPGEALELTVTAKYRISSTGAWASAAASMRGRYSEDVGAIASARHGDVIAYASALAMVRRLHRAFAGSQVDQVGGLRPIVAWQAASLHHMGDAQGDPALSAQAEVLRTLLAALPD